MLFCLKVVRQGKYRKYNMSKELIVSNHNDEVNIAILDGGYLQELHAEIDEQKYSVGDFYVGKVRKLAPSLNAAFVNIGYGKDAFLHYHDLGPQLKNVLQYTDDVLKGKRKSPKLKNISLNTTIDKNGKIADVLKPGDNILVEISKEPISTKGPRITSELSLPGRYVILVPFNDKISVSKKIQDPKERDRLRTLIGSVKPEGFGVIVRTAAKEKMVADLHADINYLFNRWNHMFRNLQKKKVPNLVLSEMDKSSKILRDNFNSQDYKAIICDDQELVEEMQEYISVISPGNEKMVKYYDKPTPLFEYYNINKQIKQSFGKSVNIPQSRGGYLVIEHTEALHVIDVNSGSTSRKKTELENSAFEMNVKAATEIARQLRLRDMGGIIVVDFIDMKANQHRRDLYEHLKAEMAKDNAKSKVLPPSKFGLIQITRQRVRPEIHIKTQEENPNKGGEVESPFKVIERIETQVSELAPLVKGPLYIHCHSFVAAYLNQNWISIKRKWSMKYKKKIVVIPRDAYKYLEFKIKDKNKEVLYKYSN